jgi:hypothetical protein
MTTNQIHALSTVQFHAMTSAQSSVMTVAQINALKSLTPIVLDLNGDGVQTVGLGNGVQFDLAATGTKVNTGWIAGGDGLLALDRNHDGVINDGSELFGSGTTLANGQKAGTGYEAMAELDTNGDGSIDAKDGAFADLRVWVDGNADGVSQADELKSLDQLGITKLNLDVKKDVTVNNGNVIGLTSTFETADGATHAAADVWFAVSPVNNLSSNVSGLAQALSSFSGDSTTTAAPKLDIPGNGTTGGAAQLADALKQYGADGKPVLGGESMTSSDSALRLKALQSGTSHGFLAVPSK